ncbi:MAG: accessory factor UbiK family protein [Pseudomonadota bacterium]
MLNPKFLDDLSARVAELVSSSPAKDLEKNARALLGSVFARLDLVTREEYEVQREVLARTRDKLATLEQRIAELEERLARDESSPG